MRLSKQHHSTLKAIKYRKNAKGYALLPILDKKIGSRHSVANIRRLIQACFRQMKKQGPRKHHPPCTSPTSHVLLLLTPRCEASIQPFLSPSKHIAPPDSANKPRRNPALDSLLNLARETIPQRGIHAKFPPNSTMCQVRVMGLVRDSPAHLIICEIISTVK